jgi:hypothetical protein
MSSFKEISSNHSFPRKKFGSLLLALSMISSGTAGLACRNVSVKQESINVLQKINTGNIDLDRHISNYMKENDPSRQLNLDEIKTISKKTPIESGEVFFSKEGDNFIEGKLKLGVVDCKNGNFYPLTDIFKYENVEREDPWIYNYISQNIKNKSQYSEKIFKESKFILRKSC